MMAHLIFMQKIGVHNFEDRIRNLYRYNLYINTLILTGFEKSSSYCKCIRLWRQSRFLLFSHKLKSTKAILNQFLKIETNQRYKVIRSTNLFQCLWKFSLILKCKTNFSVLFVISNKYGLVPTRLTYYTYINDYHKI